MAYQESNQYIGDQNKAWVAPLNIWSNIYQHAETPQLWKQIVMTEFISSPPIYNQLFLLQLMYLIPRPSMPWSVSCQILILNIDNNLYKAWIRLQDYFISFSTCVITSWEKKQFNFIKDTEKPKFITIVSIDFFHWWFSNTFVQYFPCTVLSVFTSVILLIPIYICSVNNVLCVLWR